MKPFFLGFEKNALNAQKARALAKQFGLVPEEAWKWGLRNLRKGKTLQQLGMAPKKMVDAAKRIGVEKETGAFWGKGAKGRLGQLGKGTENGYDLGYISKDLRRNKDFMEAASNAIYGVDPFKNTGRAAKEYLKTVKPHSKMHTLHTHPAGLKEGLETEKAILEGLRERKKMVGLSKKERESALSFAEPKYKHRYEKQFDAPNPLLGALEKRHSSAHPELMPSGVVTRNPYNPQYAQDVGMMHLHDVGTHHNIVSPGIGIGVHTVRPDKGGKSLTGKRIRSLLFKEK